MATLQKSQTGAQKNETRNTTAPKQAGVASEQIAARAYEIWVASGRPAGRDQEHWFQAERELRGGQGARGGR